MPRHLAVWCLKGLVSPKWAKNTWYLKMGKNLSTMDASAYLIVSEEARCLNASAWSREHTEDWQIIQQYTRLPRTDSLWIAAPCRTFRWSNYETIRRDRRTTPYPGSQSRCFWRAGYGQFFRIQAAKAATGDSAEPAARYAPVDR